MKLPVLGSVSTADRPCIEVTTRLADTERYCHQ
jgi:hypothetical protein